MPLLFGLGLVVTISPIVLVAAVLRLLGCIEPKALLAQLASWALVAAGTVPLCYFWLILWLRTEHFAWALSGPGPFPSIGGGPFMLWTVLLVATGTGLCWSAAAWLIVWVHRC